MEVNKLVFDHTAREFWSFRLRPSQLIGVVILIFSMVIIPPNS